MSQQDVLASLDIDQVVGFYRRLAMDVDKNKGQLSVSLSAMLLNHWLDNRDPSSTFKFDAPAHLKSHALVIAAQKYHRAVFLTQKKARLGRSIEKWAGVVPRLQGKKPFRKWDGKTALSMDYQSLVEMPLRYQLTGNDGDRDLLYGLRGFQLKSYVTLRPSVVHGKSDLKVEFVTFEAQVLDTYDWNYQEHLTVPNPDYENKHGVDAPVTPKSKDVKVYHTNAKRLEDARRAAPYKLVSNRWHPNIAGLKDPAILDTNKQL